MSLDFANRSSTLDGVLLEPSPSWSGQEPILKIPQSSLGYHANNLYPAFPPKMADGRSVVSNWQPESMTNQRLMTEHHIRSNWMYRKYLTHHAKDVMAKNAQEAANDTGYVYRFQNTHGDRNAPILVSSLQDPIPRVRGQPLQDGSLKGTYLTREQLNERKHMTPLV